MKNILIIEDDPALNQGLKYDLQAEPYHVISAFDCQQGMDLFQTNRVDLLLLDISLPDGTGYDLCSAIRRKSDIPIIFLTACDLERDQLKGFDSGADDYITKPFSMNILHKRIRAALRHSTIRTKEALYNDGYLSVDFEQMTAKRGGESILLTPIEFKLLHLLLQNRTQVMTKQLLLEKIWDTNENFVDEHTVTVNINRLRGKIEHDNHHYIRTIYGMGYQWTETQNE